MTTKTLQNTFALAHDEAIFYNSCWSYWSSLEVLNTEWFRLIFDKREQLQKHITKYPLTKEVETLGVLKIGTVEVFVVLRKQSPDLYLATHLCGYDTLAPEAVVVETISLMDKEHNVTTMAKDKYKATKFIFIKE
jgi:hypothetical protein